MSGLNTSLQDRLRAALGSGGDGGGCGCHPSFEQDILVIDASDCEFGGTLETSGDCRETAIGALTERDVEVVRTRTCGRERVYEDDAAALLVAAGRFVDAVDFHDERLARRALGDPLAASREATGRADAVAEVAAETGLAELTARANDYETALAAAVRPTVSHWRVETAPPSHARLTDTWDLQTGGTVRRYDTGRGPATYHLEPLGEKLSDGELEVLAGAYRRLANGEFDGGDRAPARAVRAAVSDRHELSEDDLTADQVGGIGVERVGRVLAKHTRGYGLLEDMFADPTVSDVFVTAPAPSNRVRVTVDGEQLVTNATLTEEGVAALSSRFRRESGRAFSRADPTLDATTQIASRRIRIAGVTDPPSTGTAFAFRAHDRDVWTLPALLANGTLSTAAGALLSLSVERGRAVLLAGPRGAGKTTMLGALLWELPPTVRTVVIEDTPELPVVSLQESGRDVQQLCAGTDGKTLAPADALRTALRLGDGALAVGEVRGEEACVLYEAMRVGANSEAVLGTIHGDGGEAVYERVVSDLGVSPTAFGVTDLVVTLEITDGGDRRVREIEEVIGRERPTFGTLFQRNGDSLAASGRIGRGNSHLVANLTAPGETYADVRDRLADRERVLSTMGERGEGDGATVTAADDSRQ